jgi:hypothetical protein
MTEISVTRTTVTKDGFTFAVEVADRAGRSTHAVTLSRADHERLSSGKEAPEDLVRRSFAFLLDRERKESILGAFDLTDIRRYFPEFEETIRR